MSNVIGKGKRIILIQRHVESFYNLEQKKFRIEHGFPVDDVLPENNWVKYKIDPKLQDADITDLGLQQCKEASKQLGKYKDIHYVLTSPLRRCIKTFNNTFENYDKSQLKEIKAMECFQERLDSCCDIPDKTRQLREEYRHVDFSFMDKFPIPDIWFVYTMAERHQKKFLSIAEDFLSKGGSSLGALKEIKDQFLVQIKAERPNGGEVNSEMVMRAKKFKKRLVKEILELEKKKGARVENFEVLVCSHVKMILFVTATEFDESTQAPLGGRSLDNGEIIEWEIELPSGI